VQSQLGAIVNIMISTLMGQSNTALFIFAAERPVFLREYSTDHYAIVPYFLAHLCTEALHSFSAILAQALITYWMIGFQMAFGQFLVITYSLALTATAVTVMLGAFFEDTKSAAGLFTLIIIPQFYFSGLFISIEFIPIWVRWTQYVQSNVWVSIGLCV
jgi:ABC-type multidrug transport system permease subunit